MTWFSSILTFLGRLCPSVGSCSSSCNSVCCAWSLSKEYKNRSPSALPRSPTRGGLKISSCATAVVKQEPVSKLTDKTQTWRCGVDV